MHQATIEKLQNSELNLKGAKKNRIFYFHFPGCGLVERRCRKAAVVFTQLSAVYGRKWLPVNDYPGTSGQAGGEATCRHCPVVTSHCGGEDAVLDHHSLHLLRFSGGMRWHIGQIVRGHGTNSSPSPELTFCLSLLVCASLSSF